jgi:hypothetical protein
MPHRSKTAAFLLVVLLMFMPFTAVVSADGGAQAPASYAFLPSWSGAISGDLDQTGDSTTHQFTNHDFDDEGNMYYVVGDDYGNWMNNQYSANGRGFHLLKIDAEGLVEYGEKITCSNYCNSPDYFYTKVVGVHVVDEDQFYVTLSAYNTYLTFGGAQYYASSHNLVTAFYNNGSWDWVDLEQTTGYAYNSLAYQDLGEDGTLYTVLIGSSASGYLDYSITSATTTGTNWVRMLEVPYAAPTYNYMTPLFDVNESGLHMFLTTSNSIKYDSQTILCPLGGEEGYCNMWVSVGTNGAKQSMVSSPYTSIHFTDMMIENGSMYLTGNTRDFVSGSDTESNFTGQKISHSPRYAQYIAVMDNTGNWDGHMAVNEQSEGYQLSPKLLGIDSDGSVIFSDWYVGQTSINGALITQYSDLILEYIVSKIDIETGIEWSANVGFDDDDLLPFHSHSDGETVAFIIGHESNSETRYQYQGVEVNSPTGSNNYEVLWVDLDDGEIVDVESTTATMVNGRSNDGGVIASGYNYMFFFMPDFDGDNVGTNDNCPDTYNPTQGDYNSNGDGDACDPDDDSDGIMDGFDTCPLGVLSWTSESITDHDGDGCKDSTDEDLDDDNDGKPDSTDACPVGITGASYDLDGDGCKDVEDNDDDGDLVRDESDLCSMGVIDWSSGTLTDHDGDGCLDDDPEDADDDNDGIADSIDACPRGAVDWPSNINTDFDGDGCRDAFEDEDDDNDGISNSIDDCPRSIGVVNAQGCSATQTLDDENGGSSVVYYVCPAGSLVVLDPTDCPEDDSNSGSQQNNNSTNEETPFYYVCPGGTDVVTDLGECSETISTGGTEVTLVVDPSSNESSDYYTCPGGKAIVINAEDCPGETTDSAASNSESEEGGLMVIFMGGTFAMSAIAVIVVLVRRPTVQQSEFTAIDSTNHMFKEEVKIPTTQEVKPTPPPSANGTPPTSKPSSELIGQAHEGQEWLEWPEGSNNHWYREVGFGGDWKKYDQ